MKVFLLIHEWTVEGENNYEVLGACLTIDRATNALMEEFKHTKDNPIMGEEWSYEEVNEYEDFAQLGNLDRSHRFFVIEREAQ